MKNRLKLVDNHLFEMGKFGRKLRLVVYKGNVEKVCRQESLKKLMNFTLQDEANLFKGRLQLHKSGGEISVVVKGEIVGRIAVKTFAEYLEEIKNNPAEL